MSSLYVDNFLVQVSAEEDYTFTWSNTSHTFTVLLDDLQFAWSLYTVDVRMIPASANKSDGRLWSEGVTASQRTRARPPDSPPHTCLGSFQVVDNSDSRTVLVYWQQIDVKYHNGPAFNYTAFLLTDSAPVPPVLLTPSFAKFEGLTVGNALSFSVRATNLVGSSNRSSTVTVPPQSLVSNVTPQSVTTIYSSEDSSYTVSWYPPDSSHPVVSYTVFWCETNSSLPHSCSGRLEWGQARSLTSVAGLEPGLNTLVYRLALDSDKEYRLAVAANTESGSSGLAWSSCIVINNRMITTVRNLAEERRGDTWLVVRWSLPCSERGGAVVGYNVTWCPAHSHAHSLQVDCRTKTVQNVQRSTFNITNLAAWTEYTVSLTVITMGQTLPGGTSHPVTLRTRASRPTSPPAKLSVIETSNTTARLSWNKPSFPNGPVTSYKVICSFNHKSIFKKFEKFTLSRALI